MTDWGAHHVDIAQWAIGMDHSGPITIEPLSATFPVPMRKGYPTKDDCFNAATAFMVKCTFANGVELIVRNDTDKGILFEGDKGRFSSTAEGSRASRPSASWTTRFPKTCSDNSVKARRRTATWATSSLA